MVAIINSFRYRYTYRFAQYIMQYANLDFFYTSYLKVQRFDRNVTFNSRHNLIAIFSSNDSNNYLI